MRRATVPESMVLWRYSAAPKRNALSPGAGIASAIYYPIPLHRQEVYAERFRDVTLPVSEKTASQVLSLPMYPELAGEQIDHICSIIRKAL